MQQFEIDYAKLIEEVLSNGVVKQTRNAATRSLFGLQLKIDTHNSSKLALIQGRKMYPRGVLGELAAILREPYTVRDFEAWGCNYWSKWADESGYLNIDYGKAWYAEGQIEFLKECLANDPNNRRMLINAWRPDRLSQLSLPCCHYSYQFYVADGYLSMVWIQRSVDMMIGLPSDILFAHAWLIAIANEFGYKTGEITMQLGDCHIYEQHYTGQPELGGRSPVEEYLANVLHTDKSYYANEPHYIFTAELGKDFCQFDPGELLITADYDCGPKLNLELYA